MLFYIYPIVPYAPAFLHSFLFPVTVVKGIGPKRHIYFYSLVLDVFLCYSKTNLSTQFLAVFLSIGIPTIERNNNGKKVDYLNTTLSILISKLSPAERRQVLIVIFCADQDPKKQQVTIANLQQNFQKHIQTGLIQILLAPKRFYSRIDNLPRNFNDTELRVKWRSKQSLDIAFMFYYMHGLSEFYLHLEDDVKTEDDFFETIRHDSKEKFKTEWVMIMYFKMGFIGKLIKSDILSPMADFLRNFYYEMPPDWLYSIFVKLLEKNGVELIGSRTLFHHLGVQSSSGNTRK